MINSYTLTALNDYSSLTLNRFFTQTEKEKLMGICVKANHAFSDESKLLKVAQAESNEMLEDSIRCNNFLLLHADSKRAGDVLLCELVKLRRDCLRRRDSLPFHSREQWITYCTRAQDDWHRFLDLAMLSLLSGDRLEAVRRLRQLAEANCIIAIKILLCECGAEMTGAEQITQLKKLAILSEKLLIETPKWVTEKIGELSNRGQTAGVDERTVRFFDGDNFSSGGRFGFKR